MLRRVVLTVVVLTGLASNIHAQTGQQTSSQLSPSARAIREMFEFLLGSWEGEGSGEPGQGTGGFVFEASLDGNLITRRSHAEYPASKDRPPVKHEDFMTVYGE